MLSPRQKELKAAQNADINGENASIFDDRVLVKVKVGDKVTFTDTPEFNGEVVRITKDQWANIIIYYGVPGRSYILLPSQLTKLISTGKASVSRPNLNQKGTVKL